jgi:hypothetical protein
MGKTNEQYKKEISQLESKNSKIQKDLEALKKENEEQQE